MVPFLAVFAFWHPADGPSQPPSEPERLRVRAGPSWAVCSLPGTELGRKAAFSSLF